MNHENCPIWHFHSCLLPASNLVLSMICTVAVTGMAVLAELILPGNFKIEKKQRRTGGLPYCELVNMATEMSSLWSDKSHSSSYLPLECCCYNLEKVMAGLLKISRQQKYHFYN